MVEPVCVRVACLRRLLSHSGVQHVAGGDDNRDGGVWNFSMGVESSRSYDLAWKSRGRSTMIVLLLSTKAVDRS